MKLTWKSFAFIIFLFLPLLTNLYAQQFSEIYLSNGQHVKIDRPKGSVSSVMIENGKAISVQTENPEEAVRLIVTFKEQPLAVYRAKKSSTAEIFHDICIFIFAGRSYIFQGSAEYRKSAAISSA